MFGHFSTLCNKGLKYVSRFLTTVSNTLRELHSLLSSTKLHILGIVIKKDKPFINTLKSTGLRVKP